MFAPASAAGRYSIRFDFPKVLTKLEVPDETLNSVSNFPGDLIRIAPGI
jgi:hypothetical protein